MYRTWRWATPDMPTWLAAGFEIDDDVNYRDLMTSCSDRHGWYIQTGFWIAGPPEVGHARYGTVQYGNVDGDGKGHP